MNHCSIKDVHCKKKKGYLVKRKRCLLVILFCCYWLVARQALAVVLNNPYPPEESTQAIYYTTFSEQPKTLDPARAYSVNESQFIAQIYEPVLQYDYLARPYQLIPLTAKAMPEVRYYDSDHHELTEDAPASKVAYSVYTIHIKSGLLFQPHPAFAKDEQGRYRYHHLSPNYLNEHAIDDLKDFPFQGTRELKAEDYIYQIKRLASPAISSPIYGFMSEYIVGFNEFSKVVAAQKHNGFLDLRQYPLRGVKKLDDYRYEITIKGRYPQFIFWLAMPFFSPVPWEAALFYAQPGMEDKNLGLGWYPVGTGPFMLTENNPNSRMILTANPNYHEDYFPQKATFNDKKAGLLHHAGARLPLIKKAVYTLEKEAIPRWNKFLQGYYDLSGISADSFDQAVKINALGQTTLTPALQAKGIRLTSVPEAALFYLGFNMLDEVIGGTSERARLLRQAISIALNTEEQIAIFYNGRGQAAQGPIPPGLFGYREGKAGMNPYVYQWNGHRAERKPLDKARQLMKKAGYAKGIDPKTGKPLMLHYDVTATGGPDDKAHLNWMRKQFAKLGIALDIRSTQFNRFQEKLRTGNAQLFSFGWRADYPDAENFLFLLYGPNGKVRHHGENVSNYQNARFDRLFEEMKSYPNHQKRQQIIDKMVEIVRHDAPWVWGIHSESLLLDQQWVAPFKPHAIANNTLKYMAINFSLRNRLRRAWNQPVWWPLGIFLALTVVFLLPFYRAYRQKNKAVARRFIL